MRRILTVVALSSLGALLLLRCGSNNNNKDAGIADEDGGLADAAVATDAGTLTPASCTPITNEGCDGGFCFTTAIDQMGNQTFACGPAGPGGDYAPCTSSLDCQANFSCLMLKDETELTCHQYCSGALGCPGTEQAPQDCISYMLPTVGYCFRVPPCNLFLQDCAQNAGCDAGVGCYPVSGFGGCLCAGTNTLGASCVRHADCIPGNVCIPTGIETDAGSSKTCQVVCDPASSDAGCQPPQSCHQVTGRTWGFCD